MNRLSSGQERMWLLQQMNPASSSYNARIALRFARGVDRAALRESLDILLARHAVLKSVFRVADDGTPYAVEATDFTIPVHWDRVEGDWHAIAEGFAEEPFDLAVAPPARGMVVVQPDGSAVLCLVFHHIVMDGRSFAVLVDELSTVYETRLRGDVAELPELPGTYQDYVSWQRENTTPDAIESRMAYWREELAGATALDLPVDFPRPARFTERGHTHEFALSAELTTALKIIALRWRCTLSSAVAGMFQTALALYTGQDEVLMGVVLNGRQRMEFEDVIGLFVNTVTLRTKVAEAPDFREFLRTVQASMNRAYAHQDVPFDQVVAQLRPDRRTDRNPLFEVLFIYQGEHAPSTETTSTLQRLPWLDLMTRFDIEMRAEVVEERLTGTFIYRPELFSAATIERLGELITSLIERLIKDPDGSLSGANLLGAGTTTDAALPQDHQHRRGYVVGPQLTLLPPGVVGELYVPAQDTSGEGLVPDPWAPAGALMRPTGELASRQPDATVRVLGRIEDCVRLDGLLVDTADLARTIGRHPDLARVVVAADSGQHGEAGLVCFVRGRGSVRPDIAEVRAFAVQELPERLVPSVFVVLESWPTDSDGAVIRADLPFPGVALAGMGRAPRNLREEVLCALVADILGLPAVSIDDDFFQLGGHSLLVAQLVSRVRVELSAELSIRAVFENPTIARLSSMLDGAAGTRKPLLPRVTLDRIPLSFPQRRLWFHYQAQGADPTYNMPIALRLTGPLDRAVLTEAFNDVLGRHESLRTVFPSTDGNPYQEVLDTRISIEHVHAAEGDIQDAVDKAALYPFDLTAEIPIKVWLWEARPDEHTLLVLIHHIAGDGVSLGPFSRDLGQAYAARLDGHAPQWTPLPVQYSDYAQWQLELLGDIRDARKLAARQGSYWQDQLAGLPAEVSPMADRSRAAVASMAGARISTELGPDLHARLKDLAVRNHVSLNMLLNAGLAVLLTKLGCGTDIPIGGVVAGRSDEATADLVGFFVNTLVLRYDLAGDPTFEELLARVREVNLGAHDHQDLDFEQVVDLVAPPRVLGRHPLFQVMLVFQSFEEGRFELPGLTVARRGVNVKVAKFDLHLAFTERPNMRGVECVLDYATDLFDEATAERFVERLLRTLTQLGAHPDRSIDRIDVLGDVERDNVRRWNSTAVKLPAVTLTELLDRGMRANPDAEALVFGGERLTYADLDRRSGELAMTLRSRGAGPEQVVAVSLARSAELVIALVAVLRAGAAYLPIEPDLPEGRRAAMIADAEPVLVLDDELWGELAGAGGNTRYTEPALHPRNPAYLLFTSGSTGRPKGVVIEHEAIVNRLLWMQAEFRLGADDRVLQKTPAGFDVSVWEFFWPLIQGATLVVAAPGGHRDPRYLAAVLREERITTIHFVPSMLDSFLTELGPDLGRFELRRVICSGEALPPALLRRYAQSVSAPLFNLYGPTEAAVDVTSWPCDVEEPAIPLPIGAPVWNTRLRVLDTKLNTVAIGVPGELYLAGVQLARGYQHNPRLTAERFVADPSGPPGARMYRTGDLVRWTPTGNLQYLGRDDDQVKLRGVRIEPAEISSAVAAHPAVDQAAVSVYEPTPDVQRLVAYVVPSAEAAPGVRTMARWEQTGEVDDLPRHPLPNGRLVVGRNAAEIEYLYEEIFERQEYLRHGITVPDGAIVFDVGAHVGMFSLFAGTRASDVTVYAFEPIPELYREMVANTTLNDVRTHAFRYGLSDQAGTAEFVYYPQFSMLSGQFSDVEEASTLAGSRIKRLAQGPGDLAALTGELEVLISQRLQERQEITCELRALSSVIDEHHIERIDLLKVDAENSELEVLNGIRAEHWPMIGQVVVEVHDTGDRLDSVVALLAERGFQTASETADLLVDSGLVNVFAVRPGTVRPVAAPADDRWFDPDRFSAALRATAEQLLTPAMLPTDYVYLDVLPVSVNGKLDRKALPAPKRVTVVGKAPSTPQEARLAELFARSLGAERVGVDANFFELGGHSLLAARLVGMIKESLGVELGVGAIFQAPTVTELSALIGAGGTGDALDVLMPIRTGGDGTPIFFLHPGIGLSWCYFGFGRHLSGNPLYTIQSRAVHGLDSMVLDIPAMATDYLEQVRGVQPHGPYRFVGWSFGGNIAHTMSTMLGEAGEEVELLAVLDSYPYAGTPPDIANPDIAEVNPLHIALVRQCFPQMDASRTIDEERLTLLAGILTRHQWLASHHEPGVHRGDIVHFQAAGHPDEWRLNPHSWRDYISGEVRSHPMGVSHFDLLAADYLPRIADVIEAELRRVRS